jgi:hypothetical protein
MPYSTEVSFPGLTVSLTSKKILVNKPVDLQIFNMPGSSGSPPNATGAK